MKLNQLRAIAAIAEHGSLRAAARHLGLAQPALTRSVHDLEHELGGALFERRARGMSLTPMGAAFARRAQTILNDVQRARDEAGQILGSATGTVVVGLSVAAHLATLPDVLMRFRARYPDVRLRIVEGLFPMLETELRDGTVDFYIGPTPSRPISKEFLVDLLFENTRVVVSRIGHPLSGAKELADLTQAEWVTTSVTYAAPDELNTLFVTRGLPPPRLTIQAQSALSMITAVACSDALAMVPIQFTDFALTKGVLAVIPVRDILPAPPITFVRRAGLTLTPAADWLADCCLRAISTRYKPPKGRLAQAR